MDGSHLIGWTIALAAIAAHWFEVWEFPGVTWLGGWISHRKAFRRLRLPPQAQKFKLSQRQLSLTTLQIFLFVGIVAAAVVGILAFSSQSDFAVASVPKAVHVPFRRFGNLSSITASIFSPLKNH